MDHVPSHLRPRWRLDISIVLQNAAPCLTFIALYALSGGGMMSWSYYSVALNRKVKVIVGMTSVP